MKTFAIQFSNYNFKSAIIFTDASSETEAINKVHNYVIPLRFVYERTLSDKEVNEHNVNNIFSI